MDAEFKERMLKALDAPKLWSDAEVISVASWLAHALVPKLSPDECMFLARIAMEDIRGARASLTDELGGKRS